MIIKYCRYQYCNVIAARRDASYLQKRITATLVSQKEYTEISYNSLPITDCYGPAVNSRLTTSSRAMFFNFLF